MSKTLLIVLYGPHCTGKTSIGKKIAREFKLPFISKDEVKECLFDNLGHGTLKQVERLKNPAWNITWYFIASLMEAGASMVVEANYRPEYDSERFNRFRKKYGFEPFQISCQADSDVLLDRFKNRSKMSNRHPGHLDDLSLPFFKDDILKGKTDKLDIGGYFFDINTTDFAKVDYNKLFNAIREAFEN